MVKIFSEYSSPRLLYTLDFIFQGILQEKYHIFDHVSDFECIAGIAINYSDRDIPGALTIRPHSLLYETNIQSYFHIEVEKIDDKYFFFRTADEGIIQHDIFASTFYLISRYEEYLNTNFDDHGRFPHTESLAFKNGFIQEPVVDQWIFYLKEILQTIYPKHSFKERKFQFLPSFDFDVPFRYKHKGWMRTLGAFIKDTFHASKNFERIQVLMNLKPDPSDQFEYIIRICKENKLNPTFFILYSKLGRFDRSVYFKNKAYNKFLQRISTQVNLGIHPSYRSLDDPKQIKYQKESLSKTIGIEIVYNRFHYIRMRLPHSYLHLLEAGIIHDFSMGYASISGFRAGTCTPFYFFNLEKNNKTNLFVLPFEIMDATLQHYSKLSAHDAWNTMKDIITKIKKVEGLFIPVFHNDSLSDEGVWKNWRQVFEKMIQFCCKHD